MNKNIQVFKPYFRINEVLDEIKECLEKGWTGIGYKTDSFENLWKDKMGFSNAHFLNSATSGLHLAINIFKELYKWKCGDEIITSSLTFVSTNHAILYENLNPVFADVDESLCLDPSSVEKLITKKTKALIYVGIGGNAKHYNALFDLCKKNNLIFILDAAHMAGTRWKNDNSHVGLNADCSIFSYQAVKNCPSADAGMICFKEDALDKIARKKSWLGIDKTTFSRCAEGSYKWKYEVNDLGFKYHGNSIIASMCIVSLKYLDEDNAYRRKLASLYDNKLSQFSEIKIVNHSDEIISSRHLYQIRVSNRDGLIEKLASSNIYCGVHYINNSDYGLYKHCDAQDPRSRELSKQIVSLPLHLHIEESDIDYIVESIIR